MKNPIPLQFLVGLTRLIAIFFCIRSIDQLFGAVMSYRIMQSMSETQGFKMPSPWSMFLPGLLVYATIAVGVWIAAPWVCRVATPPPPADETQSESHTCWNEVMIFLVGTMFVGFGIARLSTVLIAIAKVNKARAEALGYNFDYADKTSMATTVMLIGFGIIFMKRFPSIHRWIQRKSLAGKGILSGEQNAARDGDKPAN